MGGKGIISTLHVDGNRRKGESKGGEYVIYYIGALRIPGNNSLEISWLL